MLVYEEQLSPFVWLKNRTSYEWWDITRQVTSGLELLADHGVYQSDLVLLSPYLGEHRRVHYRMIDYPPTLLRDPGDNEHDDSSTTRQRQAPVVNQGNLMANANGTIKIIDFGNAVLPGKALPMISHSRLTVLSLCTALPRGLFGEGFAWWDSTPSGVATSTSATRAGAPSHSSHPSHPSCVWDGAKAAMFLAHVEHFGACHRDTNTTPGLLEGGSGGSGGASSLVDPRWRASLSEKAPPCVEIKE